MWIFLTENIVRSLHFAGLMKKAGKCTTRAYFAFMNYDEGSTMSGYQQQFVTSLIRAFFVVVGAAISDE